MTQIDVVPDLAVPREPAFDTARLASSTAQRGGGVLAVLAVGGLANFALVYFVQPILPRLVATFGISEGVSGSALSVTTGAMLVGLVLAGPVADRVGRTRAISLSLLASGVVTVLGALAPTWELFLVTRGLAGLTLAILPAIALAVVRDIAPHGGHLRANALYIAGTAVGGALGRLAPLPIAELVGWRYAAAVLGVVSVAAGIASRAWLPQAAPRESATGLRGALAGLAQVARCGPIAVTCGIGVAGMVVFVTAYNAVGFRLQAPPFELGAAESLIYLAYVPGILGPVAFRPIAARWGRTAAALVGVVAIAVATAILMVPTVPAIAIGLGVMTFAFLGLHSVLSGWVVHSAHARGLDTARASSLYLLAFYLGSTVAGTASTHVWEASGWSGVALVSSVAVTLGGALVAVRWSRAGSSGHA